MSAIFISCVLILAIIPFNLLHAEDNKNIITLSEGLKIATENNRLVKIAFSERDISYEDTIISRSKLLPNINANMSQTFLSRQPGAHMGTQQVYTSERDYLSYGINAYQSIFSFGENISRYEASKSILDAKNST
ncbi:TolC family protein [Dissulfurispira sp.]|uniref:TolC family protein n=1 Tax=Dissulfurispira sp. TaxID=2817609 RepID=UPI002FDB6112